MFRLTSHVFKECRIDQCKGISFHLIRKTAGMCRLEKDTDGTMDAHEGNHTPTDGAGMEGEGGKPDTRPGDRLAIIRRNPGLSVFTHAATLTAIMVLYNWFGQTYLLSRLSLAYILYFFPGLLITPMTALLVTAFLHDRLSWKKIICIIVLSYCLTILGVFLNELWCWRKDAALEGLRNIWLFIDQPTPAITFYGLQGWPTIIYGIGLALRSLIKRSTSL